MRILSVTSGQRGSHGLSVSPGKKEPSHTGVGPPTSRSLAFVSLSRMIRSELAPRAVPHPPEAPGEPRAQWSLLRAACQRDSSPAGAAGWSRRDSMSTVVCRGRVGRHTRRVAASSLRQSACTETSLHAELAARESGLSDARCRLGGARILGRYARAAGAGESAERVGAPARHGVASEARPTGKLRGLTAGRCRWSRRCVPSARQSGPPRRDQDIALLVA